MHRIREAREAAGLSQEALAAKVGKSQTWVQRIEAGHRNLMANDLALLAKVLDVSPNWLLGTSDDGGPTQLSGAA